MSRYKQKQNYVVEKYIVENIIYYLSDFPNKTILYIGYADQNLCRALFEKYGDRALFWDWFDRTNLSVHEWEGDDEEFCANFPVSKWAKDLYFIIGTGVPAHNILLIDIPLEFDFKEAIQGKAYKLAELIILFGDADSSYMPSEYRWSNINGLTIGELIQ